MLSLQLGVGILFISVHGATAAPSTGGGGGCGGGSGGGGTAYILTKNRFPFTRDGLSPAFDQPRGPTIDAVVGVKVRKVRPRKTQRCQWQERGNGGSV
uniref:Putative secreted protein n=1 Tax=Anopheles darlingi TaxID=43151 RepID=A0A2M4D1F0_ANODA